MKDIDPLFCLSLMFPQANPYFFKMYRIFDDAEQLLNRILSKKIPDPSGKLSNMADSFSLELAQDIVAYCDKNEIKIITIEDEAYPPKLAAVDCPPIALYCMGDICALNISPAIAVVGARNACAYSLKAADYFAYTLAMEGAAVVSGFAKGIDTAAHSAAIRAGGKTIAVLGCGIHYDYPKGKWSFKCEVSKNGLVLSEYPPLTPPAPDNFRVRNRIISGLSDAVTVVEAGSRSGSLNTVNHALDQGRDVFVVPPRDIFSRKFSGQCMLLCDGAQVVCSPQEILGRLGYEVCD